MRYSKIAIGALFGMLGLANAHDVSTCLNVQSDEVGVTTVPSSAGPRSDLSKLQQIEESGN